MAIGRMIPAVVIAAAMAGLPLLAAEGPVAHVRLPVGEPAPEILATTMEGAPATLASLKGRPVVLQFGSITEPLFRLRVPASEKLAAKYAEKAAFVILYDQESHAADSPAAIDDNTQAGFDIASPTSEAERYKVAQQAIDRLHIKNQQVWVDAWSNTSALRYGNYPNMTFVIDADGKLEAGYPWMDPKKVQGAIDALLAGKEVPEALRGSVHRGAPPATDYETPAMEMTGYGAAAKLAVVIDRMQLTEAEKEGIMPALSQYLVDARNFRQTRIGAPAKGEAAATEPAKAVSAGDLRTDIEKLRASAQKLEDACRDTLPANEAKEILDTLDQGPGRRLFTGN